MTNEPLDQGLELDRPAVVEDRQRTNIAILELNDHLERLRYARIATYVVGGLTTAVGLYYLTTEADVAESIGVIVEGLLYIGFGIFMPRKPLVFISLAIGLYILDFVMGLMIEPASVFSGWLIKIVIIIAFGRGIMAARKVPTILRHLRSVGVSEAHLEPATSFKDVSRVAR